ncbi:MAG: acetylxylan esterase, partial [Tannerellaceae bacterium]|nr:acetylxylan esterase [Tannerellaceae bacterium]
MKTTNLCMLVSFLLTLFCSAAIAQQSRMVDVRVAPEHADWLYRTGEKVKFNIAVAKNDVNLKDVEIRYEISEDMMQPLQVKTLVLKDGQTTVDAGTMKTPGFLRCIVYAKYEGKEYQGMATAGFDPEKIQPTTTLPADFVSFWDNAKAENAKIPMDAKVTLLPDRCTEKVNVYHVNLQNYRWGARLYAIMCVPKAPGKYPAVLHVPGAGIRPYGGDTRNAEKGMITFEIGIHGVPVNMPTS